MNLPTTWVRTVVVSSFINNICFLPIFFTDVINVAWVKTYLNSLKNVTSIIVSHDSGLLNDCCTNILAFDNLKLRTYKGNLDEYVKVNPLPALTFP